VYATLYRETRLLGRLIDDLRTLSLADSGEQPLVQQSIRPRALLEQAVARHAMAAQQKDIRIRLEARDDLPQYG
jgi:signal transduction histidine kinase